MVRRIRRVIGDRARAVHADLQPSSYLMLTYVAENGPMRASAIAEQFDIDKGAISRQVTAPDRPRAARPDHRPRRRPGHARVGQRRGPYAG